MIAATFHGSSYSPPNYDFDTIAVFPSLEEAIDQLFNLYTSGHRHEVSTTYLDGHSECVLMPGVEIGDSFTCYLMPELDDSDDLESAVEALEGRRLAVHTAVHGGWNDYILTLATGTRGDVVVEVSKAGI